MHTQQIACDVQAVSFPTVLQLLELEVSNMTFRNIIGTLPSSWSSLTQVSTYTIVFAHEAMHARDSLPCKDRGSDFSILVSES